ncbi:hypothetical protein M407DRAFT_17890 [Tulasnella calospora MUT 4182]|uniref:Uncharacterized protein n=1 Tax=Tulasnella calospora MUT 4182 TaxID=1051891 RepID=A0A0C3QL32_9AGAM|nr:hypothetical protein M407DRAFT_17890 [Tulasnella calospora MUT 4182]
MSTSASGFHARGYPSAPSVLKMPRRRLLQAKAVKHLKWYMGRPGMLRAMITAETPGSGRGLTVRAILNILMIYLCKRWENDTR